MLMRVFVGFGLSIKTKEQLYDLQRVWLSYAETKTPVSFENYHITLKYLGKMEEKEVEHLYHSLKKELKETSLFCIRINDIGSFVKYGKQIIWAGVTDGRGQLIALHNKVVKAIENISFPIQKERYAPHVTLGRQVTFERDITWLPIPDVIEKVDHVTIFLSHQVNGTLTYSPLYEVELV